MISSKSIKRVLFGLAGLAFLSLSSCAYNQIMNERRAQNYDLQRELAAEQERTESLRR